MRIFSKVQIKTSLSNPLSTIIRFQLFRKSLHIPVLFVPESCIVSLNEGGVCCKILCNHLWLGKLQCKKSIKHVKMFKNNPVKNIFIFNPPCFLFIINKNSVLSYAFFGTKLYLQAQIICYNNSTNRFDNFKILMYN